MYASHVLEVAENENPRLEDFHVLQEFRDVFPDEIPGFPPKRYIDFTIELVPRAAPVSKTPYKMSTPEFIELKMHCYTADWHLFVRVLTSLRSAHKRTLMD